MAFDVPYSWLAKGGGLEYINDAHARMKKKLDCKKLFLTDDGKPFQSHSLTSWFQKVQMTYGQNVIERPIPPSKMRTHVFATAVGDMRTHGNMAGPSMSAAVKPMATSMKQVKSHYDLHHRERGEEDAIERMGEFRRHCRRLHASSHAATSYDDARDIPGVENLDDFEEDVDEDMLECGDNDASGTGSGSGPSSGPSSGPGSASTSASGFGSGAGDDDDDGDDDASTANTRALARVRALVHASMRARAQAHMRARAHAHNRARMLARNLA